MKKDKIITIRLNSREYQILYDKSKDLNIDISKLVRTLLISAL